jgi:hypothetical protein
LAPYAPEGVVISPPERDNYKWAHLLSYTGRNPFAFLWGSSLASGCHLSCVALVGAETGKVDHES